MTILPEDKDLAKYRDAMAALASGIKGARLSDVDVVVLRGYLLDGQKDAKGEVLTYKIYLEPTFKDYVEIPADALVKWVPLANDLFPLSGALVWIKAAD